MLNYIRADLRRILRRVPRIVVTVLIFVIVGIVVMNSILTENLNSIGFMAKVATIFTVTNLFLGMVEILAVFADDFKAKTMQVAIGLGVTRPMVVLSKAIEYLLLALMDTLVLAVLLFAESAAFGITLNGDDVYQILIRVIFAALSMLVPALFTMIPIFWMQGTGIAALLFLVFYIDPGAQIISLFFNMEEIVVNLHLNELPYTALLGAATTRLTLHMGFPILQVLGIVAYIAAAYILTVLAFSKRELEF